MMWATTAFAIVALTNCVLSFILIRLANKNWKASKSKLKEAEEVFAAVKGLALRVADLGNSAVAQGKVIQWPTKGTDAVN